ncbi:GLABROUS1 enhancer-binding protein-like 1 [Vicia villosa]|uniref:GLABROUS1 enhancer-binding protein-like 1 n=1 Tax=Vicia villosa TaxID=3911 RepID=UPI00273CE354|nr:GLABROUS1 enhancer-binding protein-like 1 [Vicia villosa]
MTHQHQKIFPTKPSPSAQSCTNPPPQPILPSIPKQTNPPPQPILPSILKQTATTSKSRTRLFSANDEIVILKALSDYKSKTGHDPMKHFTGFYNSFNHSLSFQPTQKQFHKRVWKLKDKFVKNKKVLTFSISSPHQIEVFELSLKVWGRDIAPKKLKKPSKPSKPQSVVVDSESAKGRSKEEKVNICLREMFRFGEMGLDVLKRGMDLVGESERLEFDRRWKKLRVQESRVFLQRAELVEKQLELIYKALQGSS